MTATLDRPRAPAKSGNGASRAKERRWGDNGRSNPIARAASTKLGLRESYVELLLRPRTGLNIRCAALIEEMRAQGADAQALRFYEPIRRAYEKRHPQHLTLQLVEDENAACHAAHIAELRYLESRSDADLSLEIRALHRALARMAQLCDAAEAEEQRRMRSQS